MMKKLLVIGMVLGIVLWPMVVTKADGPQPPAVLGPAVHAGVFNPREIGPNETTVCGSQHSVPSASDQQIVNLTNQLRASHGLTALSISPSLERSADTHALQEATTGIFGHDSYSATLARTQSCGSPTTSIDENTAGNGSGDPTATFNQYVNSPEHLSILLDPSMVSVGVATEEGIYNDGTTVWQNFFMNDMVFASTADSGSNPTPTPQPTPQPTGPVVNVPSGPTGVGVGQVATFSVTGSGAKQPYFYMTFGDNTSAPWQVSGIFTHSYGQVGTYTVMAWIGDASTQQTSAPKQAKITVGVPPTPTPTPTPQPTPTPTPTPTVICQSVYLRNSVLTAGPMMVCP